MILVFGMNPAARPVLAVVIANSLKPLNESDRLLSLASRSWL
jgi:hypothetical protein